MNTKNTSNGDFLNELQQILEANLKGSEFGAGIVAVR